VKAQGAFFVASLCKHVIDELVQANAHNRPFAVLGLKDKIVGKIAIALYCEPPIHIGDEDCLKPKYDQLEGPSHGLLILQQGIER